MVRFTINILQMLAYIHHTWILWVRDHFSFWRRNQRCARNKRRIIGRRYHEERWVACSSVVFLPTKKSMNKNWLVGFLWLIWLIMIINNLLQIINICISGWWFGTWLLFSISYGFHFFQRGRYTTNQMIYEKHRHLHIQNVDECWRTCWWATAEPLSFQWGQPWLLTREPRLLFRAGAMCAVHWPCSF